jgi:hypothetical protein
MEGKRQGEAFAYPFRCDVLALSARFVAGHKDVLLNAVDSYRAAILKAGKWPETVLDDPELSLLPGLKARIESFSEIDGNLFKLLRTVVSEYQKSLMELSKEGWVNRAEIEELLLELNVKEFREDLT